MGSKPPPAALPAQRRPTRPAVPDITWGCEQDPSGQQQGPFPRDDVLLWLEQGYFTSSLPLKLADAPPGTPYTTLGAMQPLWQQADATGADVRTLFQQQQQQAQAKEQQDQQAAAAHRLTEMLMKQQQQQQVGSTCPCLAVTSLMQVMLHTQANAQAARQAWTAPSIATAGSCSHERAG